MTHRRRHAGNGRRHHRQGCSPQALLDHVRSKLNPKMNEGKDNHARSNRSWCEMSERRRHSECRTRLPDVVLVDVVEGMPRQGPDPRRAARSWIRFRRHGRELHETSATPIRRHHRRIARRPACRDDLLPPTWNHGQRRQRGSCKFPDSILLIRLHPLDAKWLPRPKLSGFPKERVVGMAVSSTPPSANRYCEKAKRRR